MGRFQKFGSLSLPFIVCRENILVLDIFFEALNYETIEQKKAYEVAGLLGEITFFLTASWSRSYRCQTSRAGVTFGADFNVMQNLHVPPFPSMWVGVVGDYPEREIIVLKEHAKIRDWDASKDLTYVFLSLPYR